MMKLSTLVLSFPFSVRQRRSAQNRRGGSFKSFSDELGVEDVGEERAARFVWDELEGLVVYPRFHPSPYDNLLYFYGLGPEEVDELAAGALLAAGVPLPPEDDPIEFAPLETPADIFRLIRAAREVSEREG
jgi:hypothetical protein